MIALRNFKTLIYPAQQSHTCIVFKLAYVTVFADFRGGGDRNFTPTFSLEKFL